MDKKYRKNFEVYYHEINRYQEASPVAILNYLGETAISHSESVGYGIEKLKLDRMGWVLNRWFLKMDKYPLWGEKVSVETWPSKLERFYATREFLIFNGSWEIIGRATSLWIYLSLDSKRPQRIPAEFGSAYGVNPLRAVNEPFEQLPVPDCPQQEREFGVRRSDIDTNGHVNNTRYAEWISETVPQDIYDNFVLSSLELVYKKELGYGLAICSQVQSLAAGNWEYGHRILTKKDNKELAVGRTKWKKR